MKNEIAEAGDSIGDYVQASGAFFPEEGVMEQMIGTLNLDKDHPHVSEIAMIAPR